MADRAPSIPDQTSSSLAAPKPAWRKAISPQRDQTQSRAMSWGLCLLLAASAVRPIHLALPPWHAPSLLACAALGSLAFALAAWRLRAATAPAAGAGGIVCLLLILCFDQHTGDRLQSIADPLPPALLALIALFVLTFSATRFGRARKQRLGLAEPRTGRRLAQILANLAIAALFAAAGLYPAVLAALAEATADTISSETGQAIGGTTWSISTLRRVPTGTDGGISLAGTALGSLAALLVVLAGAPAHHTLPTLLLAGTSALIGLFADSLLGATIERRGWIGNDLVNLSSTLIAALAALLLTHLAGIAP